MTGDVTRPWDRLPKEPQRWWVRFEQYRLLGPGRQKIMVAREEYARTRPQKPVPKDLPGHWKQAAERYEWDERAADWDEAVLAEREAEWEKRREQVRNEEWTAARRLLDMANEMLTVPILHPEQTTVEEDTPEGKRTTITNVVTPAGWDMADALRVLQLFSKLSRQAVGMPTEHVQVEDDYLRALTVSQHELACELVDVLEADLARRSAPEGKSAGV